MTWRVLLDQNGLKTSRPGANVLTASGADLFFNSNYAINPIFMRGSSYFTEAQASQTPRYINFGKTFSQPPLVAFRVTAPNAEWSFFNRYWGVNALTMGAQSFNVDVENSRIKIVYGNTFYQPGPLTVYYVVLDM